jgi:hypothetical protein
MIAQTAAAGAPVRHSDARHRQGGKEPKGSSPKVQGVTHAEAWHRAVEAARACGMLAD